MIYKSGIHSALKMTYSNGMHQKICCQVRNHIFIIVGFQFQICVCNLRTQSNQKSQKDTKNPQSRRRGFLERKGLDIASIMCETGTKTCMVEDFNQGVSVCVCVCSCMLVTVIFKGHIINVRRKWQEMGQSCRLETGVEML